MKFFFGKNYSHAGIVFRILNAKKFRTIETNVFVLILRFASIVLRIELQKSTNNGSQKWFPGFGYMEMDMPYKAPKFDHTMTEMLPYIIPFQASISRKMELVKVTLNLIK